jgi:hypothetical protein
MMDNDDGGVLSRYSDSLCVLDYLKVSNPHPHLATTDGSYLATQSFSYSVVGKGESDFGTFILQGAYNSATRELDVTRKYVSSFDPRSSMSIPQIREALTSNPLSFPTLSPPSNLSETSPANNFNASPVPNSVSGFNSDVLPKVDSQRYP